MAMELKVTPAEVAGVADKIIQQKGRMEGIMQAMRQEVAKLPAEYWRSQSGTDYNTKYDSVQKNCQVSLERLAQHAGNLKEAASKYEQIESEQVRKVQALDGKNIF